MKRDSILAQLQRYLARHPGEEDRTRQFIDFVERNSDCLERTLEEGHLTGSGWIVDSQFRRTLLTHHRKLDLWLQPGGHADGDGDLLAVALRECEEETGLPVLSAVDTEIFDLDIHAIPARGSEPTHFHFDVRYLFRSGEDEEYTVTEESHDLAWVEMDRLEDYTIEWSMRRMRDKALARREG